MEIFVVIRRSQQSDYHSAYHWIDTDVVAMCESMRAAYQHINTLLDNEYKYDVKSWEEGGKKWDKPDEGDYTNLRHFTEEFNGEGGEYMNLFYVEERSLIEEQDDDGFGNTCPACGGDLMEGCLDINGEMSGCDGLPDYDMYTESHDDFYNDERTSAQLGTLDVLKELKDKLGEH